jgi:hypothetical protein
VPILSAQYDIAMTLKKEVEGVCMSVHDFGVGAVGNEKEVI